LPANSKKANIYENMDIRFYNTLSRKKENLKPQGKTVKMYHCGPTVYDYVHIGNLRSYIFADILRRTVEENRFKIKQVINITDVGHLTKDLEDEGEDKIEKGATREGKTAKEIVSFFTKAFLEDLKKINVKTEKTLFPKASDHIKEQIALIKKLEKKGLTYETSDGIYFDTSKISDYGKLAGLKKSGLKEGARVKKSAEKRNPTDFSLWRFSPKDVKRQQEWESPWGVGFPGWHIECSAMSMKYLGNVFDIHTGGIDHIPVHHSNEIAQSEAVTGKPFVRFWMHNAFVNISGGKMAKSLGNFLRLKDIEEKGVDPISLRYWFLSAHYRSPISFSWEALENAERALKKLRDHFQSLSGKKEKPNKIYLEKFKKYLNDDLDTPKALAFLWQILKDKKISDGQKKSLTLEFDKILGLELDKKEEKIKIPEEIKKLAEKREKAREDKNWQEADRVRNIIRQKGFEIKDTEKGPEITQTNS